MVKQRKGLMTQIVRAKEELKLSHSTPSQRQASGTNQRIKALRQCRHWVWGLTHHHAVKEETIAIAVIAVTTRYVDCRMVSMLYSTFITFDYLFELILIFFTVLLIL